MTVTLLQGDCLDVLPTLPAESVQTCITSPPYFGLRDYQTATWEGGDAGCDHAIGRIMGNANKGAVRTVLDTDLSHCGKCGALRIDSQIGLESTPEEYVAKLVAVFREVRRVLKDDGTVWLNLGDSYWGGKGENGSSKARATATERGYVQSGGTVQMSKRPTDGHHDVIKPKDLIGIPWRVAFALQADGWWLRSDIIWHKPNPMPESVTDRCTKAHEYVFLLSKASRYYYDADAIKEAATDCKPRPAKVNRWDGEQGHDTKAGFAKGTRAYFDRNRRSVWTIPTSPYKGAHFATWPEKLVEPMVLAGCPVGGTVLDPFNGSGTTGAVAVSLGRDYVGIELNPAYLEMARQRISKARMPLLLETTS